MNKILNFASKHLIASIAIVTGVVAIVTAASSFIVSGIQYSVYVKEYEKNKEEKDAILPKPPKSILFDNDYVVYNDDGDVVSSKSKYKNSYVYFARDAIVNPTEEDAPASYKKIDGTSWEVITGLAKRGGSITYEIDVENYGLSDIDIVLASSWTDSSNVVHEMGNLTDFVKLEINGQLINTTEFALPEDGEFQHLILKDTHLIAGKNKLVIKTAVYNSLGGSDHYVIPDLRNITVITNSVINLEHVVEE